ncbi:zf-HC2 domain-containing protein [Streptomyces sp. NPDC051320]|uniref:anti-sigma factor family protein n=1 Tax=Streptomyces sp. NPDC051320 TaxID=3154644 RepID=UPI003418FF0F
MSGSSPTPAEQHLGDRLAALVDGELNHDARERVLAHLATCPRCKTEADAQRRLKSVFAETAPPPPSEGLLARLQGLPGGPGDDRGSGGPFGGRFTDEFFGPAGRPDDRAADPRFDGFGYVPEGPHAGPPAPALPDGGPGSGFRIHPVGRSGHERSAWRGRRFAFAAASAVSLAAIALGGTLPLDGSGEAAARTDVNGNNVTPLNAAQPVGISSAADRRRHGDGVFTMGGRTQEQALPPSTFAADRSVPAVAPTPVRPLLYSLTTPLLRTPPPGPATTPGSAKPALPSSSGLPVSSAH